MKITVTAFNNFVNFDKISAALGAAPRDAVLCYDRINTVKQDKFSCGIPTFLSVLENNGFKDDAFIAKVLTKKGDVRKIPAVKHDFLGFFVNIDMR